MMVRFHCERAGRKNARKAKHKVLDTCANLKKVLSLNPDYGVLIPGKEGLRKMRLMVPGLNTGKSGGYRLIYRAEIIDEVWHIIFLKTYFKGDRDDLTSSEYKEMLHLSEEIFANPFEFEWED
ncbi:MAG: hypothetical protein R3C61_22065 [Bacteroidia bacterium]